MAQDVSNYITAGAGLVGALFGASGAVSVGLLAQRGQRRQAATSARRETYAELLSNARKMQAALASNDTIDLRGVSRARDEFTLSLDKAQLMANLPVRASLERWDALQRSIDTLDLMNVAVRHEMKVNWENAHRNFLDLSILELDIGVSPGKRQRTAFISAILSVPMTCIVIVLSSKTQGGLQAKSGAALVLALLFGLSLTAALAVVMHAMYSWRDWRGAVNFLDRSKVDPFIVCVMVTWVLLIATLPMAIYGVSETVRTLALTVAAIMPPFGVAFSFPPLSAIWRRRSSQAAFGDPGAPAGSGAVRPSAQEGRPGPPGPA